MFFLLCAGQLIHIFPATWPLGSSSCNTCPAFGPSSWGWIIRQVIWWPNGAYSLPWVEHIELTASNSIGEKRNLSDMRYGIMAMTKKGKARAAGEDFTAHKMPSPRICCFHTCFHRCVRYCVGIESNLQFQGHEYLLFLNSQHKQHFVHLWSASRGNGKMDW